MLKLRTRWQWMMGSVAIVLLAAGCFQQAGSGAPQASDVSSLPTFTPPPTLPPPPSNTPPPTEVVIITATPVVADASSLLASPTSAIVIPVVTAAPTQIIGSAQDATGTEGGVAVAQQPSPDIPPLQLTATAVIAQATQAAGVPLTQTAVSLGILPPTATPDPLGVQPTTQADTGAPLVLGADCVHEVRAGDSNLYRISLVYGVTVADIAQASGIVNPDLISIGQQLTIPGCGTTGAVPLPTSTPETAAIVGGTPLPGVTPTVGAPTTTTAGQTYRVQQGDTMFALSVRFGVSINAIAAANGITNTDLIFVNQDLVIPSSG